MKFFILFILKSFLLPQEIFSFTFIPILFNIILFLSYNFIHLFRPLLFSNFNPLFFLHILKFFLEALQSFIDLKFLNDFPIFIYCSLILQLVNYFTFKNFLISILFTLHFHIRYGILLILFHFTNNFISMLCINSFQFFLQKVHHPIYNYHLKGLHNYTFLFALKKSFWLRVSLQLRKLIQKGMQLMVDIFNRIQVN